MEPPTRFASGSDRVSRPPSRALRVWTTMQVCPACYTIVCLIPPPASSWWGG